ncbi:MAG: hypothetical protein WBL95_27915 [Microcoleus sp.]
MKLLTDDVLLGSAVDVSALSDEGVVRIAKATTGSVTGGFEGSQKTLKLDSNGGGTAEYSYEFFDIPDELILRYDGKEILNTGFVSGKGEGKIDLPLGNSDKLQVILATDNVKTEWQYTISTTPPDSTTTPPNSTTNPTTTTPDTSTTPGTPITTPGTTTAPNNTTTPGTPITTPGTTNTPNTTTSSTVITIGNKHTLYEFLAKDTAYKIEWKIGDIVADKLIGGRSYKDAVPALEDYGYVVDKVFNEDSKRKTGFYALGLKSNKGKPPVLVIRGTEPGNNLLADIFADADQRGIGFNQFENNKEELSEWLQKNPRSDIAGHSLGGALSQMIAAEFTSKAGGLGEIVTFNSPGISKEKADLFRRGLTENVKHYIAAGDFVSLAGESFIEGSSQILSSSDWGEDNNIIERTVKRFANRHLRPMLVDDVGYDKPFTSQDDIKKPSTTSSQISNSNTVTWLNSPLFTYLDTEFLTLMAGASLATFSSGAINTLPDPKKPELQEKFKNSFLFFRGKVEEIRKGVDQVDAGGNRFAGPVRLGGNFVPALRELASAVNTFDIQNGIIGIPVPPLQLGGVRLEPSGFNIKKETNALKLQGKASLIFPLAGRAVSSRITADLAGDNFFRVKNNGFDVVGAISADYIPIVPNVWEIKNVLLKYDSLQNKIGGEGSVVFPNKMEIGGFLEFNNGQLNALGFDANKLNVPIFNTGLSLKQIKGGVNNLTVPEQILFNGGVRLTNQGADISYTPPDWVPIVGGQEISFPILDIDIDGDLNRERLQGKGLTKILGGILGEGTATAELNWNKGFLEIRDFDISALGGAITVEQNQGKPALKLTKNLDFTMGGNAQVKLPQGLPEVGFFAELIRKHKRDPLAQAGFEIQYSNDYLNNGKPNFANDYIAAWGQPPGLPFALTLTFGLNGDWDLRPGAKNIPETNSFRVEPDTNWVILGTDWDNAANNVPIQVKLPNGTILNESDFASNNIAVVKELAGEKTKGVIVYNPLPGIWDMNVVNPNGLGNVRYSAFQDAAQPSVELTNVISNATNSEGIINYSAVDPDSNAKISFYYDTDNQGFDGILIKDDLAETESGTGSLTWNTEGVPTGDYYIYAIVRDENNPPVFNYSKQQVQVTQSADLSVSKIANADTVTVGNNITYTITVTNKGTSNAKEVTLADTLPEGVEFISASVNPTQKSGNKLTFNLGNLNNGEAKTINVTVTPPITGNITGSAQVTSKTFDSDATNDIAVLTTSVKPISTDLTITATGTPTTVNLGDKLTYSLTVTNNSPTKATGVTFTNELPSGLKDVSATSSKGGTPENNNGIITAELGDLNTGESAKITINATSISAGTFSNNASVTSKEVDSESVNNTLIQQTKVNAKDPDPADLDLTQTVDNPNPNVGDQVNITLALTNKGIGIASSINVTNLLPPGLSFVSDTPEQGSYDNATGVWNVGNMKDNLTRTLKLTAIVTAPNSITNLAAVTAVNEPDPNPLNSQASLTINPIGSSGFTPGQKAPILGTPGNDNLVGTFEPDLIYGLTGNDTIGGIGESDTLYGNQDDDYINGNQTNDLIIGGKGNDLLFGGKGNDQIYGDIGNDTLIGGLGQDILFGGPDVDTFVLPTNAAVATDSLADAIRDFQVGIDTIALTDGLTFSNLILIPVNNNTVIQIAGNNQILGVVAGVSPSQLSSSFVSSNLP